MRNQRADKVKCANTPERLIPLTVTQQHTIEEEEEEEEKERKGKEKRGGES